MNIYDTKSVHCSRCGKFIGEIDYDAIVTLPKCGKCANPLPENEDRRVISSVNMVEMLKL